MLSVGIIVLHCFRRSFNLLKKLNYNLCVVIDSLLQRIFACFSILFTANVDEYDGKFINSVRYIKLELFIMWMSLSHTLTQFQYW